MPEQVEAIGVPASPGCADSVCVHTRKIYDSCQSRDCVEDLRFYPTAAGQAAIESATAVRAGKAELLYVLPQIQPVGLGRGFYEVNLSFFYRAVMELSSGTSRPLVVEGLAVFTKRSVLFGSEGTAKTFSSDCCCEGQGRNRSLPVAVCEAVDPIVLSSRLVEGNCAPTTEPPLPEIPACVLSVFDDQVLWGSTQPKRIYLTLGQFSILRLERDAQLLMPVYDYCMPEKECCCADQEDDPCEIFQSVEFPVGEFFPPNSSGGIDPVARLRNHCGGS